MHEKEVVIENPAPTISEHTKMAMRTAAKASSLDDLDLEADLAHCSLFGPEDKDSIDQLPQEIEEGNIEYKLKLVDPSPERFEHLVSQMKWRLQEGQGEAIYELGVEDNGLPTGITADEMKASIATLSKMADELEADVTVLRQRDGEIGVVAEVLVRRFADDQQFFELRVATVGNVDAGKSTLLGVLTRGGLDNGRGLARTNLFRHKHEVESGRTSSVSHEILGFDSRGEVTNYSSMRPKTWTDICENASKVITFIDLAGHEKYLKTTVSGLTGMAPDFVMLMVGANMGIVGMTKEHIGVALALKVPIFVVVTKVDMCPPNVLASTLDQLSKLLKSPGCRKMPMSVRTVDDVLVVAQNFTSDRICPIFQVSNVTGENLDLLRMFLNLVPARTQWNQQLQSPAEFHIDDTFSVPGVGTVVSGTLLAGTISMNQTLQIGPDKLGKFTPVQVKTIHRKRVPVRTVKAGEAASFNLRKIKRSQIRKGMVLVDSNTTPKACWEFEAEILILYHSTTIGLRYQAVVHCGNVRQSAMIISMSNDVLRTGDKARCRFRFLCRPEFLQKDCRLIFREGKTKGIGKVVEVYPDAQPVGNLQARKSGKKPMGRPAALSI
eukprot:GFYU01005268.1.p1 GENE.GFYU01005268.1~~GFYU01005268.1.p1  ORF type:complete len:608 (+),score=145.32 GFYU01005268.1:107-1930(+)